MSWVHRVNQIELIICETSNDQTPSHRYGCTLMHSSRMFQRDILWNQVPSHAREVVKAGNKDDLKIVRVIESTQTDESIIYEIFVEGHKSDPRFEAQVKDGEAKLLTSRWKH